MRLPFLILLFIALFLSAAAFAALSVSTEFARAARHGHGAPPVGIYLEQDVGIAGRRSVGDPTAPLTLTLVLDPRSDENGRYYAETVPQLLNTYVATGQARLYFKYYLPEEEYATKTGRFKYAAAAFCYDGPDPVGFHGALFGTPEEGLDGLAARFNASDAYAACIATPPAALYDEMVETRTLRLQAPSVQIGIDGRETTTLLAPTLALIGRTVRTKQVSIGI